MPGRPLRRFRLAARLAPAAARLPRRRAAPADGGGDAGGGGADGGRLLRRPAERRPGARCAPAARRRCDRRQRPADAAGVRGKRAARWAWRRRPPPPSRAWAARRDDKGGATRLVASRRSATAIRCAARCALRGAAAASRASVARRRRPARSGSTRRCSTRLQLEGRRHAAARRRRAAHRRRHRDRARPRRRLHELCAARDAQPGRPRRHRADPAGQPRDLSPRGGVAERQRRRGARVRRLGRGARSRRGACAACASSRSQTGRPEMRQTLDRAEKFLNLVALLAALLAAVAVAIAARDFASRHLDDCAMLRVLGQPQRTIAAAYFARVRAASACWPAWSACCSASPCTTSSSGCSPGWSRRRCRRPSAWPALFGLGVGFTLLFGFGLPPVLQLARVPPLRVIRRDVGALKPASIAVLAAGARRLRRAAAGGVDRPEAGPDRGRRLRRRGRVFALLSWLAVQLLRRAVPEAARAALAGAGDAPDRRAAGLRGAAGVGAGASACSRWCCWCCCAPT